MTTDAGWYARDGQVIAGVQKLRFFPQVVASGHGCWLQTPEGRRVLDLSASWTAAGVGHAHPRVLAAVRDAMADQAGASVLSGTHPQAVLLAEDLLREVRTTGDERRVYLGHAGTDANDVALRGARRSTGRQRVLAFDGGYHGGLGGAMAISGLHVAGGAVADPDLTLLPYPDVYRPWTGRLETLLTESLRLLTEQLVGNDVAAVVVEPIQSDGGLLVPPDGFLRGLREATAEHGALLIVDEVKVGLARTGYLLAHHAEQIVPDIVTLGKALGGGLPLSAAVGPADALDSPAASALMTTIGNPVCCAAGRAVLELVRDGSVARGARERGQQLMQGMLAYSRSDRPGAACVGDVRGRGLSIGVELVQQHGNAPAPDLTSKVVLAGWDLGIVAYPVRGNVIELTPALTITETETQTAIDLVSAAIDAAAQGSVSDARVAAFDGW